MFADTEYLCHLPHHVKKLFSEPGKFTASSELLSNMNEGLDRVY